MRTKNSILNFISIYGFYILKLFLDLYRISLFLDFYGQPTHALHQVYYNVFQCLSIAESGIGVACVYKLYKPLAENNHNQVNTEFSTLKRLFNLLGIFVIGASVIISFFLPLLVKEPPFGRGLLTITFFIYVIREVFTYFLCAPQFVITADHKKYKINALIHGGLAFEQVLEIIAIKLGCNYTTYLIPAFFVRLAEYLIINKIVYKEYPWLTYVKEDDKDLHKDVFNLFFINAFDLVHTNGAVILLSAFTNSLMVSIYSFYNYIVKFCYKSTQYFYEAIKNGVGNITVTSDKDKILDEMDMTRTMYSFVAVLFCTLLYFSMSSFIGIWAGEEYVVADIVVILFLGVIYLKVMLNEAKMLVEVYGLFANIKWALLAAACLNVGLSLLLIGKLQLTGVLLATVISDALIVLTSYSYVGYKHLTGSYSLKYIIHNLKNVIIISGIVLVMKYVNVASFIPPTGYISWFVYSCVNGIIVLILTFVLFMLFYPQNFLKIVNKVIRVLKKMLFKKKEA